MQKTITEELQKKIDAQHAKGKLTARERLDALLDKGSFEEFDALRGDAVVTGRGTIGGRIVYIYAQDFTVSGGSLSKTVSQKICKVMDLAAESGAPLIGLNDSGGARIQEGVDALCGYGDIFQRNINCSGVVPQISVILGPCAGGAVYSPALTDFTIMVEGISSMFLTGPAVVKSVTGQDVDMETLGGAVVHSTKSGVAHFATPDENEAFALIRELLSYIPSNCSDQAPECSCSDSPTRSCDALPKITPESDNKAYDMYKVIEEIVDNGDFLEVHQRFARNIITAFARMGGQSVGIVANQPSVQAGVLDIDASRKAARFVRFCDSFNIPVVTLVDVPGFLCGTQQEYGAVISHGAKLLYAYGEATVPKITVEIRKAFGGAYIVMGSKHLGSDVNYAWPSAQIAVMGPSGAARILKGTTEEEYREQFCNPQKAAQEGYIDAVIEPQETRFRIIRALESLRNKRRELPRRKHDNLPL